MYINGQKVLTEYVEKYNDNDILMLDDEELVLVENDPTTTKTMTYRHKVERDFSRIVKNIDLQRFYR